MISFRELIKNTKIRLKREIEFSTKAALQKKLIEGASSYKKAATLERYFKTKGFNAPGEWHYVLRVDIRVPKCPRNKVIMGPYEYASANILYFDKTDTRDCDYCGRTLHLVHSTYYTREHVNDYAVVYMWYEGLVSEYFTYDPSYERQPEVPRGRAVAIYLCLWCLPVALQIIFEDEIPFDEYFRAGVGVSEEDQENVDEMPGHDDEIPEHDAL